MNDPDWTMCIHCATVYDLNAGPCPCQEADDDEDELGVPALA